MDEDDRDSGEVLEGKPQVRRWNDAELLELHDHIIRHSSITEQVFLYGFCSLLLWYPFISTSNRYLLMPFYIYISN